MRRPHRWGRRKTNYDSDDPLRTGQDRTPTILYARIGVQYPIRQEYCPAYRSVCSRDRHEASLLETHHREVGSFPSLQLAIKSCACCVQSPQLPIDSLTVELKGVTRDRAHEREADMKW